MTALLLPWQKFRRLRGVDRLCRSGVHELRRHHRAIDGLSRSWVGLLLLATATSLRSYLPRSAP